jgi:hypothetical protein
MEEEIKKRKGRPPGTSKKDPKEAKGPTFDITGTPKKRGRKATVKVELAPIEEVVDGEIEGTTSEKLKHFAKQIKYYDYLLNMEPYRFDLRAKKQEATNRMCFLVETL